MPELTRRQLLIGATGLATAGAGAVLWRRRRDTAAEQAVLRLAEELELVDVAPPLGNEYLATHPDETTTRTLLGHVLPDRANEEEAVRGALAERIDREYVDGEVVLLDGWVLSRTEGRLLALVTLLSVEARAGVEATSP